MREIKQFQELTPDQRADIALRVRDVLRRFPETAHNLSPDTVAMALEILDELPPTEET